MLKRWCWRIALAALIVSSYLFAGSGLAEEAGNMFSNAAQGGRYVFDETYQYRIEGSGVRQYLGDEMIREIEVPAARSLTQRGAFLYVLSGNEIVRVPKDGGEERLVVEKNIQYDRPVSIDGDWLYYMIDRTVCRMNLETFRGQSLVGTDIYSDIELFYPYEGKLYYLKGRTIFCYDPETEEKTAIPSGAASWFTIYDRYIFFSDENIYRCELDGNNPCLLLKEDEVPQSLYKYKGYVPNINFYEDRVYVLRDESQIAVYSFDGDWLYDVDAADCAEMRIVDDALYAADFRSAYQEPVEEKIDVKMDLSALRQRMLLTNDGEAAVILADGTVATTREFNTDVSTWDSIVSIDGNENYLYGLRADGTIVASEKKDMSGLAFLFKGDGINLNEWTDVIQICYGDMGLYGLRSDGTLLYYNSSYSDEYWSSRNRGAEWTNLVKLSVCDHLLLGLRADGTVVAAGENDYGQCAVGRIYRAVDVLSLGRASLILHDDGSLEFIGLDVEALGEAYGKYEGLMGYRGYGLARKQNGAFSVLFMRDVSGGFRDVESEIDPLSLFPNGFVELHSCSAGFAAIDAEGSVAFYSLPQEIYGSRSFDSQVFNAASEWRLARAEDWFDDYRPALASEGFAYELNDNGCAIILSYAGDSTDVAVPESLDGHPVSTIGKGAFEGRDEILYVHLPQGLSAIEARAFAMCGNLRSINVPGSVERIAEEAFAGCEYLCATVERMSSGEEYAKENDIYFIYPETNDWLNQ